MHSFDLILTLAGGLAAALAGGYLTHRLGLSPIVGYLFAGVLVGPYTPGFVADQHLAEQMAEIGVILLMFGVGLQFHLDELLAVRRVAIPGAFGQSVVATAIGALVAHAFGVHWNGSVVFGMALAVASTVVLVRVLTDNRDLHTVTGHIAVGWLVVEDLLTVLILVLMPPLFGPERGEGGVLIAVGLAFVKVAALAVFTMVAGGRAIPWALNRVAATGSRELFTLCVLVVALGIAVGSAKLFDVSMALGAFMAGMVVGRSEFSVRAASEALPMRDAFAVLFFVSVGMLLDPGHVLRAPWLVALTLAVVMIGKPLAALAIVLLFGYPLRVALGVAVALAQIGEFSFIVANLGSDLGMLTSEATNTVIAVAIISITANPLLYRMVDRVDLWAARRSRRVVADAAPPVQILDRAVVVGYGPVGRTVARLMRENQIDPTIIELNMETVRALRAEGIAAVYGDARHTDTLTEADVATARALIVTVSGMTSVEETIRLARQANPRLLILVRVAYLRERGALLQAGATAVFSDEGEVALAHTESVLQHLGATPEQIERERARVHAELG